MTKADTFFVVAVGSSDEGTLGQFFEAIPAPSGMAYVVLARGEQRAFSKMLKTLTRLPISEVRRGVTLKPNRVYVVSSPFTVANGKLRPENGILSVDGFFRHLAEGFENRLVGVLLDNNSGGTFGLRHVKEHWGITLATEAEEGTNSVDIAVSVSEMGQRLLTLGESSSKLAPLREKIALLESEPTKPQKEPQTDSGDGLSSILDLLKEQTGHDFINYKQPTLLRRIARRLQVHELADMAGYVDFMRKRPEEIKGLLSDLLISVTNFFRDEEAFEALRLEIIPKLFAGKTSSDTVRVWSCGCATGEEAYSLAMLFSEYTSTLPDAPKFQIFASDISEEAVRAAREGHYTLKDLEGVSEERLERFFIKENNGYRVKKEIRDLVLFAVHNVLRDPPFSRLELITCRNLLIYLNRETQEKVLKLFQFSLKPGGYLFLGSSESVESASGLFSTLDKQHRLYQSRATVTSSGALSGMPSSGKWEVKIPDLATRPVQPRASYGELHYKLLESLAPPSILVNEDDNIVHVSESAGRFLRVSGGEPTRQLFQALQPGLKLEVQRALFEAKKSAGVGSSRGVPFRLEGQDTAVTITVRLVKLEGSSSFYLVLFEPSEVDPKKLQTSFSEPSRDTFVGWLEEELQNSRDSLRMTVEQYETSAEELRASNEELQALNEELRAASEELETSKEELQSLNEELMTMIDDQKRTELALRESQYRFHIASEAAGIGIHDFDVTHNRVIWDEKIRALWGTGSHEEITYQTFAAGLHPDDLPSTQIAVDKALDPTGNGRYYAEYRVIHRRDGKVRWVAATGQTFFEHGKAVRLIGTAQDISERKRAEEALREQQRFTEGILEAAPSLTYIFDLQEGRNTFISAQTMNVLGYTSDEIQALGSNVMSHLLHPDDAAAVAERFGKILASTSDDVHDLEYRMKHKNGSWVWLLSRDKVFARDKNGKPTQILGVATEITERKENEERITRNERELRLVTDAMPALVSYVDKDLRYRQANKTYLEWFGLTFQDIIGKTMKEVLGEEALEKVLPYLETALAGEPGEFEAEVPYQHGGPRFVHAIYTPNIQKGEVTGVFIHVLDISERKRSEEKRRESEENYRTLFNSIDEGYTVIEMMLDADKNPFDYRFVEINPTFSVQTGLSQESVGKTALELVPNLEPFWIETYGKVALTGESVRFENYAEGLGRWFDVYALRVGAASDERVGILFRNITERKRLEANLAFLAEVAEEFSRLTTAEDIMQRVGEKMAVHLRLSHCLFARIDESQDRVNVEHVWHTTDARDLVGEYRLSEFVTEGFRQAARAKETIIIDDTQTDPRTDAASYKAFNIGSFISVPFHQDGTWSYLLTVNALEARNWREDEIELVREVANRVFPRLERAKAETVLREQLTLTATLTNNATQAIFMMDSSGYCTFMNPAAETMLGFSFEEIRVRPLHDMIHHHHPDGRFYPINECPIDRALPENFDIREHEDTFIRKNGEFFPVLVAASPIFKDGKPVSTVVEVRDISERKRSEESLRASEEKYRAITELSSHMVWVLSPEGEITYLSNKWFEYTGLSEEDIYRTGWLKALHPDDKDRITAEFGEALAKGKPYTMELRLKNKKGDYCWHLSRAVPIEENGKLSRWLGVTFDINEQKETERKLRESEASLREADKRKDEFLATLGHELRNPLAPIRMGVELMKRTSDPETLNEARDIIARQSEQLNHLLDDLLDVSRISRGIVVLQKEKVDLAEVVGMAVESTKPLLEDRSHTLHIHLPNGSVSLEADKTRLCQIVSNLLTNSAKYTNPNGTIELKAWLETREVIICVKDNGIGIPEDMLEKVFDMFTRVERKESYQQQGLGIGLNLVKQLTELHGGSIKAESSGEGQGSTFTLRLPANSNAALNSSEETPVPTSMKVARRVLVVDDYAANLKTLSRMLLLMGHEVATAARGEEVLECLETFKPDLVLLDINMPGMSGYEVASQIRANTSYQYLKVVALTGYGQAEDIERTRAAGFDDHLVKPVGLERLEEVLTKA